MSAVYPRSILILILPFRPISTPAVFRSVSDSPLVNKNGNIKQVVEEEQTQPEYLQELLQSLLKDLQILNEIQPLKQETSNQIQKDQEEKSIVELLAEERLQKANQALNESQSPS
ncbi:hypothetical protein Tco_0538569 [Tanacetum coccineum]